jgi:K+-sensing histidine kinase KdpD
MRTTQKQTARERERERAKGGRGGGEQNAVLEFVLSNNLSIYLSMSRSSSFVQVSLSLSLVSSFFLSAVIAVSYLTTIETHSIVTSPKKHNVILFEQTASFTVRDSQRVQTYNSIDTTNTLTISSMTIVSLSAIDLIDDHTRTSIHIIDCSSRVFFFFLRLFLFCFCFFLFILDETRLECLRACRTQ